MSLFNVIEHLLMPKVLSFHLLFFTIKYFPRVILVMSTFTLTFLMVASMLLQLFRSSMSTSYMPQNLDYSSPKKVSKDLNRHSTHIGLAVIGHSIRSASQAGPSAEQHMKIANELS